MIIFSCVGRNNRVDQLHLIRKCIGKETTTVVSREVLINRQFVSVDDTTGVNIETTTVYGSGICGYRIEEIEDPLTKKVRYLDKLVDELAKGKKMDKILREA